MRANVSRVTQEGHVVIPIKLRKKPEIHDGTAVISLEEDGRLILRPTTKKYVAKLRRVSKGEPSVLKRPLRERRRKK
jgi:bifunctional DNA-binding transcriptional regulator/antitoxin component of YhaV-PrlF toxin-antitoxin module